MAVLRVDDFRNKLGGGGARPNLFNVLVNFPGYSGGDKEETSFMCKGAQLPGSTLGIIPVPFRGRQVKLVGDRTFEPWTITVFNDTDFNVRNAFETWMDGMNGHSTNLGTFSNDAGSVYATNMEVEQLDQTGVPIKTYFLKNAFPTAISPIDLSYDANDQVEEFTVTIEFDYWTNDNTT